MKLLPRHDENSIGLIGHSIIGYPSLEATKELVAIMVAEGVELIELQIPFSEPMADGPLFTRANFAALANGVRLKDCFKLMEDLSGKYAIPFAFMTYANIVFVKGYEEFVNLAKKSGAKAAIIPDLPVDLSTEYFHACQNHHFAPIQIIPPNVDTERLKVLCHFSRGFVYAVARTGVTGAKTKLGQDLVDFIHRIRRETDLPVAVGFGISTSEDIQFLKPHADYAVIGTETLRLYENEGYKGVERFWRELREAANTP